MSETKGTETTWVDNILENVNDAVELCSSPEGDARAIVEAINGVTLSMIQVARFIEPLTSKIVKALDAEQRERDEAEPEREYCHGCSDCAFGRYITQMYENRPQQHPFCLYPDDTEERDGRLGAAEEDLPTDPPDDCPLAGKDLLVILDV